MSETSENKKFIYRMEQLGTVDKDDLDNLKPFFVMVAYTTKPPNPMHEVKVRCVMSSNSYIALEKVLTELGVQSNQVWAQQVISDEDFVNAKRAHLKFVLSGGVD